MDSVQNIQVVRAVAAAYFLSDGACMEPGSITVASAASTSASAAKSCQCGNSESTSMPLNTPTTGVISEDKDDTPTGTVVTIFYQAQWQNTNATTTL